MKNPNDLSKEERILVLNILKEINHQMPDYSDVHVGNVIMYQSLTKKAWMPKDCIGVPHNVKILLDNICGYGFLEYADNLNCYKITQFGLEYLKLNL